MFEKQIVLVRNKYTGKLEDRTKDIEFASDNGRGVIIKFEGNSTSYPYSYAKARLCNFEKEVNLSKSSFSALLIDGKEKDNIAKIGKYDHVYAIVCNGRDYIEYYEANRITIIRPTNADKILLYLTGIAEEIKLPEQEGEKDSGDEAAGDERGNHLAAFMKNIKLDSNSTLYYYLNSKPIAKSIDREDIVYPFSLNLSQKEAIYRAFSKNISVIQGPPGTGKTQTILNIVANIILRGQTVGIVSNNNAAVENVKEKLEKNGYGFLIANLGSRKKKDYFFENAAQTPLNIDPNWKKSTQEVSDAKWQLKEIMRDIELALECQIQLADSRLALDKLEAEYKHFLNEKKPEEQPLLSSLEKWDIERLTKLRAALVSLPYKLRLRNRFRYISYRIRYGKKFSLIYKASDSEMNIYMDDIIYRRLLLNYTTRIADLEAKLEQYDLKGLLAKCEERSRLVFNANLYKKYHKFNQSEFDAEETFRGKYSDFTKRYPITVSTTHSIISSVGRGALLDYIIIDESSQVDLVTATLAFSKCKNVVVVGDSRQLSHIAGVDADMATSIARETGMADDRYDYYKHNILESLSQLYGSKLPSTLLKEHYRCNPLIIDFCNRKYYDGQLVVMTKNNVAKDDIEHFPVRLITSEGRMYNKVNQRQIEVIKKEVLPIYSPDQYKDIGIVTPYRFHADAIAKEVCAGKPIESDTTHKYQGREKDIMIFTTASHELVKFVDNPNLINVAVSRAKNQLLLIAYSGYENRHGSNIGDLMRYIRYCNPDAVQESDIISVYDILHEEYSKRLKKYMEHDPRFKYLSEGATYELIKEVIKEGKYDGVSICFNYPLYRLVSDYSSFTERERQFASHRLSHIDFLLMNSCDNSPILAIEVDGGTHRNDQKQQERDEVKNEVLKKCNIPLLRLPTNGHSEKGKIAERMKKCISPCVKGTNKIA